MVTAMTSADEQNKIISLMGAIVIDRHIYHMRCVWCVMLQMVSFVTLTLALVSPPPLGQSMQLAFIVVPLFAILGLEVVRRAALADFQLVDWMLDVFSNRLHQLLAVAGETKVLEVNS